MSAIGMPAHMLAYFHARPQLEYLAPMTKHKMPRYGGMAECTSLFEDDPPPPIIPFETPKERKQRLLHEKRLRHEEERREKIKEYRAHIQDLITNSDNSNGDTKLTEDALATLFIGRVSYETTEKKLKKEFEQFGPIKYIRLLYDWNGKPRGYGFIEFENDYDMKETYKKMDGKKIDGWRLVVDVERGRTVHGWLPRRLGGGQGPQRCARKPGSTSHTSTHLPMLSGPLNYDRERLHSRDRHSRERSDRNIDRDYRSHYDKERSHRDHHKRDYQSYRSSRRSPPRERRQKEYDTKRRRSRSRSRSRGHARERRRDY